MTILLISEPGADGVFRHVEGLTHFLVHKGHQVHLAFSDCRASDALWDLVEFVREHGGRCLNLRVSNSPKPNDVLALSKLHHFARSIRPDTIHAHSSKAGALGRALALLGIRARYFYTPHAYYGLSNRENPAETAFNLMERLLGRIGTTINISEDEAAFAQEKLGIAARSQRIIHNPVADLFFALRTADARRSAREQLHIPANSIVCGTVGRLVPQKDPVTLYKAFGCVAARFPDLFLVHLGDGPLQDEVLRVAAELEFASRVRLLGYTEQALTVYQSMDFLVMSSRYEAGWPLSILEAMAQNLPIVTTACLGCTDIAKAGLSHCWTAPVADVGALASAMQMALSDSARERECNHREIARSRFSVERCYGAVLSTYKEDNA